MTMTRTWTEFLESRGARAGSARLADAAHALAAARSGSIVAALAHLRVLEFSGDDARAFLHGQLSCDVANLAAGRSVRGCYCTPKGRVLASFLLWNDGKAFRMALASDLAAPIGKRLQMYVLRARVVISDAEDAEVIFGVNGPDGEAALHSALGAVPRELHDVIAHDRATVVRLAAERFLLVARREPAAALWDALAARLTPTGPAAWQWLEVVSGIPLVTVATQDQFVPQMVNLELLDAVNFRKGCYPGQEIVARSQHLGKVKRRMFLAHVPDAAAAAGDTVFSGQAGDAGGAEAHGMIVNAAPAPEGGADVLAVVQTASVAAGDVRLRAPDGPPLAFRPLPYPVE
ncbi:MAG: folate-binding protein YgfZ [Burkholderiales bacterium]|nr:folate-binding protein YgfZ [Burkholderiales bacterium]